MKPLATALAFAAIALMAESAIAQSRQETRPRVRVTPAAVHPDVVKMIKAGVHPEVARMIVSNRNTTPDGSPLVPNLSLVEWRHAMDTHSGVPPAISGSSQRNPWVDRHSPSVRAAAGLR